MFEDVIFKHLRGKKGNCLNISAKDIIDGTIMHQKDKNKIKMKFKHHF